MREKRLEPALANGELSRLDLLNILREVEEFGHQHVFLYQCSRSKASELVNENYVRKALTAIDRIDLLDEPPILGSPASLQLSDVRIEQVGAERALVMKMVEGRSYRRFLGEERSGRYITRRYEEYDQRAINLIRVHSTGLTEVRVQSWEAAREYQEDLGEVWSLASYLIPQQLFSTVPLLKARRHLWTERHKLKRRVRFRNSRLRNGLGSGLEATSGPAQGNLYDDPKLSSSLDTFWSDKDASCDDTNVMWLKQEEGTPSKDIHMRLRGAANEFAVMTKMDGADYEYVLSQVLQANR
jgi:hypothetical protein